MGFVSYGGAAGGVRAVEHLRNVFAELHTVTMRDTVTFANYWEQFDSTGQLREPERAHGEAKLLLDQLGWWAAALHPARQERPYVADT